MNSVESSTPVTTTPATIRRRIKAPTTIATKSSATPKVTPLAKSAEKPQSKSQSKSQSAPKTKAVADMTVAELKLHAKSKGIEGLSKMKRADLLEAIATAPTIRRLPQVYTMLMDTETTGLPTKLAAGKGDRFAPMSDSAMYDSSRVVQWTWGLYNDAGEAIEFHDWIIKPEGFEIPDESVAFHKITTEIAMTTGKSFAEAAEAFAASLLRCHMIVGHNIAFDINVLNAEFFRRDMKGLIKHMATKGQVCTMWNCRDLCKLPRRNGGAGFKLPALPELYKFFTDDDPDPERLHNSKYDVECTAVCFFALLKGQGGKTCTEKQTDENADDGVDDWNDDGEDEQGDVGGGWEPIA